MKQKYNVRKIVLWLLGIMVTSLVLAVIFFIITGGLTESYNNGENTITIDDKKTFDIENIKEIEIITSSSDIDFIPVDSDELMIHLYGKVTNFGIISEPKMNAFKTNDTVNVEIKSGGGVGFFNQELKLDVYIPKDYNKDLVVITSSGDTSIHDLSINNLTYKASSGDLFISSFASNNCKLKSSSGEITGKDFSGNLDINSSSGDVTIGYNEFENNIEVKTSSGDVEITLLEDSEFYLKAKTSSGRITTEFPIAIKGSSDELLEGTIKSDKNKIIVSTSSGDIEINNY